MTDISKCERVVTEQAVFYLGESNEQYSDGYLELAPHTSLTIHNREGSIENLTQSSGKCVMIVFDTEQGTNHLLHEGDGLTIKPEGAWHIHSNPFDETSITYWKFDGDIRNVIDAIRNGGKE